MDIELAAFAHAAPVGETATHPIACRQAVWLRCSSLQGMNDPAALSRLARQRARRTTRARPIAVSRMILASTCAWKRN
jgi:hypothetical protein